MTNKTVPTTEDVTAFIARLDDPQQQIDSQKLVDMMQKASGEQPILWGTIIGFGIVHYRYASGRQGDWMRIGFSPRKGKISLYITGDASRHVAELDSMGKYKIGKGCIYINRLTDVDNDKLAKLIKKMYDDPEIC